MKKTLIAVALASMVALIGACGSAGTLGGTPSYKIGKVMKFHAKKYDLVTMVVVTQAKSKGAFMSITKDIKSKKYPNADAVDIWFTKQSHSPKFKDVSGSGNYFKSAYMARMVLNAGGAVNVYSKNDINNIMQRDHGYYVTVATPGDIQKAAKAASEAASGK